MSDPDRLQSTIDFKAICGKLQGGERLAEQEEIVVYSFALEYAQETIGSVLYKPQGLMPAERDAIRDYDTQSQVVKDYLNEAFLGRLISLKKHALKKDRGHSPSVAMFDEMMALISKKLGVDEVLSGEAAEGVEDIVGRLSASHIDTLLGKVADMGFASGALPIFVKANS